MKIGDIVQAIMDINWVNDYCKQGTRMKLTRSRETSGGTRWDGTDSDGHVYYGIPPELIEVIA